MESLQLKQEMTGELEDILQFWLTHAADHENGGFLGRIDSDMTVHPEAPKGLVLNARILWTFARAYRHNPNAEYLRMADRAMAYLESCFKDPEHPGYFWMVDYLGNPLDSKKQIYGQAFYLYGITEYILATGRQDLLDLAEQLYLIVEQSFDSVHGGYRDAYARDWTEDNSLRLGEHDLNTRKTMNTQLHILEAYTNYYRVCSSPQLADQLRKLLQVTLERIVDLENGHFFMYFDDDWTVASPAVSYGHDIEGSWLILEAAEVLGDEELLARSKEAALRMADAVLKEGVDTDGAVMWEGDAAGVQDSDKHWWGQAEAIVGFVNAWQITGEDRYWQAAADCWTFTREHLIDKVHGEWFWRTDKNGVPSLAEAKVNEWKCPYHNGRACFEIIERLKDSVAGR